MAVRQRCWAGTSDAKASERILAQHVQSSLWRRTQEPTKISSAAPPAAMADAPLAPTAASWRSAGDGSSSAASKREPECGSGALCGASEALAATRAGTSCCCGGAPLPSSPASGGLLHSSAAQASTCGDSSIAACSEVAVNGRPLRRQGASAIDRRISRVCACEPRTHRMSTLALSEPQHSTTCASRSWKCTSTGASASSARRRACQRKVRNRRPEGPRKRCCAAARLRVG
jgi:hypothetical protein